jgi:hypothetical protein
MAKTAKKLMETREECPLPASYRGARYARVRPSPRTPRLNVQSCSRPTGPRVRPVVAPISAPKPNSPASASWVSPTASRDAKGVRAV